MRVLVVVLIQTIWSTLTDDEDMYEGSGADMRMIADKSVKVTASTYYPLICINRITSRT